eukprot:3746938-Pyramimonas_sp.AAC.1
MIIRSARVMACEAWVAKVPGAFAGPQRLGAGPARKNLPGISDFTTQEEAHLHHIETRAITGCAAWEPVGTVGVHSFGM